MVKERVDWEVVGSLVAVKGLRVKDSLSWEKEGPTWGMEVVRGERERNRRRRKGKRGSVGVVCGMFERGGF